MTKRTPKTGPFGKCALCRLEKKRIKSRIIPEFVLNRLRNREQQYFKLDGAAYRAELTHKDYWRYLLCEECDGRIIGSREQLVAPVFDSWTNAADRSTACETIFAQTQTRFDSIFYVVLSIFWRCSVADGYEYSNFKLPDEYEESLRQFLLDPDPDGQAWRLSPVFIDPWETVELVDLADWVRGHSVFMAWLQLAGIAWFLHKEPILGLDLADWVRGHSVFMAWLQLAGIAWFLHKEPILGLVEAEETWSGPFPVTHLFDLPGNHHAVQLAMKRAGHFGLRGKC